MAIFKGVGYFIFMCLKDSASLLFFSCLCLFASRQTHTQGNNKNNKGKQHRKNTNGNVQCDQVKKDRKKKQRSRILQAYENKNILYT
jgi:hypothetical protein